MQYDKQIFISLAFEYYLLLIAFNLIFLRSI